MQRVSLYCDRVQLNAELIAYFKEISLEAKLIKRKLKVAN